MPILPRRNTIQTKTRNIKWANYAAVPAMPVATALPIRVLRDPDGAADWLPGVFFSSPNIPLREFPLSAPPGVAFFSILRSIGSLCFPALRITVGLHLVINLSAILYFKRKERRRLCAQTP